MYRCAKITDDICLWRSQENKLIVTFGEQKAKELYDEYRFF